jgi:beta-glucosidase/6-phospho-beta-glucosidase/beta-galactosidase
MMFPEFAFGAATSAFQIEGAADRRLPDDERPDIREGDPEFIGQPSKGRPSPPVWRTGIFSAAG